MKNAILIVVIITVALYVSLNAQVPKKLSYQGLLTNSSGVPVTDGSYALRFDVYNLSTGGTLRYTETQANVPVERGTFSAILSTPASIFSESLWVEVTAFLGPGISTELTFAPRAELTSAPYAFRADTARYALSAPSQWTTSGSDIYSNNSGNVGIGTSTPDANAKLDVHGYTFAKAPLAVYDSVAGYGRNFDISWLNDVRIDNNIIERQSNKTEFQLKKPGWYRFAWTLWFQETNNGSYGLDVYKNGTMYKNGAIWSGNDPVQINGTLVVESDGNDLFKLVAYSALSDDFQVYYLNELCQFSIEYLGAE